MEKIDLDYFKGILEQQLHELLKDTGSDIKQIKDSEHREIDLIDTASDDENRNLQYRMIDRESKLIKKVREALARIEDGSYGICEKCGNDIGLMRLKARPVTNKCIDCKTQEELFEKPRYGY